jgi:flagellar biogenesis protein FliO
MSVPFALLPAVVSAATPSPDVGQAPGSAEFNLFWQSVQVIVALTVTLILLVGTVWLFRKIMRVNRAAGIPGGAIRLLEIQYFDPKKAIALVRVMNRVLIVGWAEQSVTLLGELSPEEAGSLGSRETGPSVFGNLLSRFTGGQTRQSGESPPRGE